MKEIFEPSSVNLEKTRNKILEKEKLNALLENFVLNNG